jgi:hypothetical protein
MDEYVKAWFALKLASAAFGLGARTALDST